MSYDYKVLKVLRIVDGDTVDLQIDVGFQMTTVQRIRVLGVDTPERHEPGWREATKFTASWLFPREAQLRIETFKTDSFGRYLGLIYVPSKDGRVDLGEALVAADLGRPRVR